MLTAVAYSEQETKVKKSTLTPQLEVREAVTSSDLYSAASLVASEYFDEGYLETKNENTLNEIVSSFKHCRTFLLSVDDKPAITLSFSKAQPLPMEIDALFKKEVNLLRKRGQRVVEFTKLAGRQKKSRLLCFRLMAHVCAMAFLETDVIAITVSPHHVDFYVRYAGFNLLSEERKPHPGVRGTLACGLYSHRSQILSNPSFDKHFRL